MRTRLKWLAVIAVLCGAGPASAQFANRSIGLSAGYMKLFDGQTVDWGVPIGLYATSYIDSGFDLTFHVLQAMILTERISRRQVIAIAPSLGVRYLFLEEFFRPYLGVDLSYLHIFSDIGNTNKFGLGPNVGFDYFLSDTWSLGVRGQWNVYLWLNQPVENSLSVTLELATYY